MPTIEERLRAHGPMLREITTLKHHKERYYTEDEVVMLLDALDVANTTLRPLIRELEQLKIRSTEYLEIYRVMNLELTYFKRKYPHPYVKESEDVANEI